MTAQFADIFRLDGQDFSIAGVSNGALFDASSLGLILTPGSTACYRGYVAIFGVVGERLVIADLYANLGSIDRTTGEISSQPGPAPALHGVVPIRQHRHTDSSSFTCNHVYRHLNLPLDYTGGVLLGDGFIRALYVHMGFAPAWKYTNVQELVFRAGTLTGRHDRSEACRLYREDLLREAEIRKQQSAPPADPAQSKEKTMRWIERTIDQNYTPFLT